MPYYVRLMRREDVEQVAVIDREAFPTMLPPANFQREMDSLLAHYIVACDGDNKPIVGFAGFWLMAGEAHIVNFAVRQSHQKQGIGELLLMSLIELAVVMETTLITLEVRVSNTIARRLYERYGFTDRGLRKRYYSDNREDAVIMTVDDISSPAYRKKLDELEKEYCDKRGQSVCQIAY